MNYEELLSRYNKLLNEYKILNEENFRLRAKLETFEERPKSDQLNENNSYNISENIEEIINITDTNLLSDITSTELNLFEKNNEALNNDSIKVENLNNQVINTDLFCHINNSSKPSEKIKLYMSLFKGRDDVYAKRYENLKTGTSGYVPVCLNEWKRGSCLKPKGTCNKCSNKDYERLDEKVIYSHLSGERYNCNWGRMENFIAGIYPLNIDETCHFLAIDFDDGEWEKDITLLREVANEFDLPLNVERSRSGSGAHVWVFFENPVSANIARKFGSYLLTYSMDKGSKITFKSYDRLFPNQDTMPKGGFGNLIALPLQKEAL